jgi:hypothetical protein
MICDLCGLNEAPGQKMVRLLDVVVEMSRISFLVIENLPSAGPCSFATPQRRLGSQRGDEVAQRPMGAEARRALG